MLYSKNVNKLIVDCLYTAEELENNHASHDAINVDGITLSVGFNPALVSSNKKLIQESLGEIPNEFKNGWTFLNLVTDKTGRQWGEQMDADQLLVLGLAIGELTIMGPRDSWGIFPGGMPYIQYTPEGDTNG